MRPFASSSNECLLGLLAIGDLTRVKPDLQPNGIIQHM
jgi:hypothetical protein